MGSSGTKSNPYRLRLWGIGCFVIALITCITLFIYGAYRIGKDPTNLLNIGMVVFGAAGTFYLIMSTLFYIFLLTVTYRVPWTDVFKVRKRPK